MLLVPSVTTVQSREQQERQKEENELRKKIQAEVISILSFFWRSLVFNYVHVHTTKYLW